MSFAICFLLNRGFAVRTFGLSEAHRSALNRASRRANPKLLELMLHRLSDVDRMSKGLFVESSDGDAWQELKAVCLMLSLKGSNNLWYLRTSAKRLTTKSPSSAKGTRCFFDHG